MTRKEPIRSMKIDSLDERCMACLHKNRLPPHRKGAVVIIGNRSSFSNTGGFSVSGKTHWPTSMEWFFRKIDSEDAWYTGLIDTIIQENFVNKKLFFMDYINIYWYLLKYCVSNVELPQGLQLRKMLNLSCLSRSERNFYLSLLQDDIWDLPLLWLFLSHRSNS